MNKLVREHPATAEQNTHCKTKLLGENNAAHDLDQGLPLKYSQTTISLQTTLLFFSKDFGIV